MYHVRVYLWFIQFSPSDDARVKFVSAWVAIFAAAPRAFSSLLTSTLPNAYRTEFKSENASRYNEMPANRALSFELKR